MPSSSQQISLIQRLEQATGEGIGAFLESDKPAILAAFDGWSNDAINKFVTDFANGLPSGGIKSAEFGPFRSALLSAEPSFDKTADGKIEQAFDALAGALSHLGD